MRHMKYLMAAILTALAASFCTPAPLLDVLDAREQDLLTGGGTGKCIILVGACNDQTYPSACTVTGAGSNNCVQCPPPNPYYHTCQTGPQDYTCSVTYNNQSPIYCNYVYKDVVNQITGFCPTNCANKSNTTCGGVIPNSVSGDNCP